MNTPWEPMDKSLWERIHHLMNRVSEGLDAEPAPAGDSAALADRFRRELRRYEEHRARLSPPDRERLLDFVVDDLVGLMTAYSAPAAAAAGAADASFEGRALRLLFDVGGVLAGTLEYEAALDRLARLAAGWLADACAVHLVGPGHRVRCVAGVRRTLSGAFTHAGFGPDPLEMGHVHHPVAATLRLGETLHLTDVAPDSLRRAEMAPLAASVLLVVPISVRGGVLGAITFARVARVPFVADEIALAEELARRAALAVEDARLRDEAESARRARSEFVGSISHEFRTPLMTVVAFAHLLEEGIPVPIPEQSRHHVGRILAAAGHLDRLVEEALGFQRTETGHETVHAVPVELAALARETAALIEPLARQKGLHFEVEVGDEPIPARTDQDKVRQIVLSLLGNAVKFTDRGEVRLALHVEANRAVFEVFDTGIGIAPEHLERAFEPFWQADPGDGDRGPGIGLGLPLIRRLTWMLGGDVRVESEPGRGSTFRVDIPLG